MMRPPTQVRQRQPSQPGRGRGTAQPAAGSGRKDTKNLRQRQTPRTERPPPGSTLGSEDCLSAASSCTAEKPLGPPSPKRAKDGSKDERVKVCVRVRPMSEAEVSEGFSEVVSCDLDNPGTVQISRSLPNDRSRKKETFIFDTVLPTSAGQAAMYNLIGGPILDRLIDGYNSCIIAFGATGCGKSHTIFGNQSQDRGLLPRIAETLFQDLNALNETARKQTVVKVSYLELYNEKARDLLKPDGDGKAASLEVREHPKAGIFVDGLTRSVASSAEDVHRLVEFGHKIRVVGSTHMNAHSSRSHVIVTLHLQQVLQSDGTSGVSNQMLRHSQLHAVDLAGSERLFMVGEDSLRRRESMQINKSLLALGQMISRLSKGATGSHIPYRNSKLTFLLADSLMGNCQTAMIACVSPSSSFQQLTESTLRFATSVKEIRTKPVQNEPSGDLVQSLRAEAATLRKRLRQGTCDQTQARELEAQLRGDEYLQDEFNFSYEEMQVKSKTAEGIRRRTLRRLGLGQSEAPDCIVVQKMTSDPLLSGCLTWTMAPGEQLRIGSEPDCEIFIDGLGVEAEMCRLHCLDSSQIQVLPATSSSLPLDEEGRETLHRRGSLYKKNHALVMVNNSVLQEPQNLRSGDFLRVGSNHFFRIYDGQMKPSRSEDARIMEKTFGINGIAKDAQHLRERFGAQKGDEVIRDLKDLKLVVEEANQLTQELRGSNDLSFKGRVLMDPLDNEEDPSVVVTLRKLERPETLESRSLTSCLTERTPAIATWTLPEFQQRLEVMREIYDEVRLRDLPWGQPGDLDPWHAQDNIPTITSRGTPRSSYPGSPARQSDNTPRAIPCPESLSTTLMAPPARSAESREADSPGQGRMAMILQQLPVLQAELAKAHEAQGQQAHELSSVRKELEELRQSMSMKMSPARRPSDAGITAGDIREASQASQVRHPSVPVIPAASHGNDAAASKLRARLSPPRWQGARGATPTLAPPASPPVLAAPTSPSSQAVGTPQSHKEDLAPSNLSGISSVPQGSEDRSTQLSHVSFKMDGVSCYAPARSLAEMAGCVPLQSVLPTNGAAIRRQFSAPVARMRSHVSRQSLLGTTQLRPVGSTVLPVQSAALTPRTPATPGIPLACTVGWQPPNTGGSLLLAAGHPATPRVVVPQAPMAIAPIAPQVTTPVTYVQNTPRKVEAATPRPFLRPESPSPMENAMKVARSNAFHLTSAKDVSGAPLAAPNTARYRRTTSEPVTAESLNAMAAAAKAAAQAAPGMNIVVRPVSPGQMALLNQDMRQLPTQTVPSSVDASGGARGEQLRNCQVELAGLRKEVDALGQVFRGLTLDGSTEPPQLATPQRV